MTFRRTPKTPPPAEDPHPVLAELEQRLTSLEQHCLTGLQEGIAAMNAGDLTAAVAPRTTPITTTPEDPTLAALVLRFNSMLDRAQSALAGYEELRGTLAETAADTVAQTQAHSTGSSTASRGCGPAWSGSWTPRTTSPRWRRRRAARPTT